MSNQAITILAGDGRASWDEYGLALAATTATRATCSPHKHGAVILRNRIPVSAGYDGAPSGMPHCDDAGTSGSHGHASGTCLAVHAEVNAIMHTGPEQREGATLYCTGAPCFDCALVIANSGLGEVVAADACYDGWSEVRELLLAAGVRVRVIAVERRVERRMEREAS